MANVELIELEVAGAGCKYSRGAISIRLDRERVDSNPLPTLRWCNRMEPRSYQREMFLSRLYIESTSFVPCIKHSFDSTRPRKRESIPSRGRSRRCYVYHFDFRSHPLARDNRDKRVVSLRTFPRIFLVHHFVFSSGGWFWLRGVQILFYIISKIGIANL